MKAFILLTLGSFFLFFVSCSNQDDRQKNEAQEVKRRTPLRIAEKLIDEHRLIFPNKKYYDSAEELVNNVLRKNPENLRAMLLKLDIKEQLYNSLKYWHKKDSGNITIKHIQKYENQIIATRRKMYQSESLRKKVREVSPIHPIHVLLSHEEFLKKIGRVQKANSFLKKAQTYVDTINRKSLKKDEICELIFFQTYIYCKQDDLQKAKYYLRRIKKNKPRLYTNFTYTGNNAAYLPKKPHKLKCKQLINDKDVYFKF